VTIKNAAISEDFFNEIRREQPFAAGSIVSGHLLCIIQ
jgi:hypothetical protein